MHDPIQLLTTPEYRARLDQCIHCGMCLSSCPTYEVFGTEMDGPRGRIALMRAASDGRLDEDELRGPFTTHITRCLACRACETACPSGVEYGALVEDALAVVAHVRQPTPAERLLRRIGLRELLPQRRRLRALALALWLYQRSGAQHLARRLTWLLPKPLQVMESILPPIVPRHQRLDAPAPAFGQRRGRVAFFAGCVQDAFLAGVNAASVRVLQRNGFEVVTPSSQTCCGAAHAHSGEEAAARKLARRNIAALLALDADAIIVNAGGCGLLLKEYPRLLRDHPAEARQAEALAAKTKDISEFLAGVLREVPRGSVHARAVYADSCHLRHGQKIARQPRELLRRIPGLELVELQQPARCCGSAGVYNIAQPETADHVLDAKMADIATTGAELIVTSNTGCHMQYLYGVRRAKLKAEVLHVVEVLDRAYAAG
jgi:glycolate oxidase iron-sulfur subunit